MANFNIRGAGRKPQLSAKDIEEIKMRRCNGETITALAAEYGVSRQTLSGYLNKQAEVVDYALRMDFMCGEECCTIIQVDFKREEIAICNTTEDIIHRAFGIKAKPTWEDFMHFLEERCFPRSRDNLRMVLQDLQLDSYDPLAIVEKTKGRMAEDDQWLKITHLDVPFMDGEAPYGNGGAQAL